ncbi:MAG TPA: hypothetical protein VK801_11190 [Caulobacteraceae bacterium]|jgi:hypothetical protein|nr:hypothetical protein [Caulobacteraceae bacterium]
MLKTYWLTAVFVASIAAPALVHAQAAQAKAAEAARRPGVAVVVDADKGTSMVVPINKSSREPPEVVAALQKLTATGQIKPGQMVEIVVRRGNQVTEFISNAPVPNP